MPTLTARLGKGGRRNRESRLGRDMSPSAATAIATTTTSFDSLVSAYSDELLAFAARVINSHGSDADAADALQVGLLAFYRQYGADFPGDAAEARTHLWQAIKFG